MEEVQKFLNKLWEVRHSPYVCFIQQSAHDFLNFLTHEIQKQDQLFLDSMKRVIKILRQYKKLKLNINGFDEKMHELERLIGKQDGIQKTVLEIQEFAITIMDHYVLLLKVVNDGHESLGYEEELNEHEEKMLMHLQTKIAYIHIAKKSNYYLSMMLKYMADENVFNRYQIAMQGEMPVSATSEVGFLAGKSELLLEFFDDHMQIFELMDDMFGQSFIPVITIAYSNSQRAVSNFENIEQYVDALSSLLFVSRMERELYAVWREQYDQPEFNNQHEEYNSSVTKILQTLHIEFEFKNRFTELMIRIGQTPKEKKLQNPNAPHPRSLYAKILAQAECLPSFKKLFLEYLNNHPMLNNYVFDFFQNHFEILKKANDSFDTFIKMRNETACLPPNNDEILARKTYTREKFGIIFKSKATIFSQQIPENFDDISFLPRLTGK